MQVTVVGAGRVGLTTALALDYLGHHVSCVDSDPRVVDCLRNGRLPFPDPVLESLLPGASLEVTGRLSAESAAREVVIIAVPTPPLSDGHADVSAVTAVAREVAEVMPDGEEMVLAIKSTVPPGTTERVQGLTDGILRRRRVSARIAVASNPEFLRQGTAFADTLYPDRIVIGTGDGEAEGPLLELYDRILRQDFDPPPASPRPAGFARVPLITTRPVNAELIKYAANSFLATKLSFVNEIARLAERVGADVADVARGVGLDHRIGPHYFEAGPGWGGPCLGKDTGALLALANDQCLELPLLAAAVDSNARQREHIVERLEEVVGSLQGATIGILGLSFKAGTDDTTDSPALDVVSLLLQRGARVRSYDPVAEERAKRDHPELSIAYHHCPLEMSVGCDALLVMTEWEEFKGLSWMDLARRVRRRAVVDARNLLDRQQVEAAGFSYLSIGR
jgi:UDPglucose 6-dehydrogenase